MVLKAEGSAPASPLEGVLSMYTKIHRVSGNWTLGLFEHHHFSLRQKVYVIFLSWSIARFQRSGFCLGSRVHCECLMSPVENCTCFDSDCSRRSQIVILWLWLFDCLVGCFWIFLALLQNSAAWATWVWAAGQRADMEPGETIFGGHFTRPMSGVISQSWREWGICGSHENSKFLRRLSPNLPSWTIVKDSHVNSQIR